MSNVEPEDSIDKLALMNLLNSTDKKISIIQLSQWIQAKTDGKYAIIKQN